MGSADYKSTLGKKIHRLRKIRDATQMDLARHLGFTSTGTISQVENGLKGLTTENIYRAAMFFGVHPVVLMSDYDYSDEELKMIVGFMNLIEKKGSRSYYNAIKRLLNS